MCVCWPVRGWRKNEIACEDTNTKQRDSICRQIYRSCAVVNHRKSDLENVHDMCFFLEWWPVSFRDITSALGISTLLLFWCKPPHVVCNPWRRGGKWVANGRCFVSIPGVKLFCHRPQCWLLVNINVKHQPNAFSGKNRGTQLLF